MERVSMGKIVLLFSSVKDVLRRNVVIFLLLYIAQYSESLPHLHQSKPTRMTHPIRPGRLLVCHISLRVTSSVPPSSFPVLAETRRPFWLQSGETHRAPSGCSVVSVDPVGLAAATSGYWVSAGGHVIQGT